MTERQVPPNYYEIIGRLNEACVLTESTIGALRTLELDDFDVLLLNARGQLQRAAELRKNVQ